MARHSSDSDAASTAPLIPVELKAPVETAADDVSVQRDPSSSSRSRSGWPRRRPQVPQPPKPVAATPTSRTTELGRCPHTKLTTSETKKPETHTTPGAMGRKRGRSGGRPSRSKNRRRKSTRSAESFHVSACELSSRASGNIPSYPMQLRKAGIHRKTLEYWLKRSKAGDEGYDIECQGLIWRFHEHCPNSD